MKKSVKKCLTALVAIPVAAALLTGCGKGEVKAPFDSDPYAMPVRSYSTETTISNDTAFGSTIAQPTLEDGSVAYVSSVGNNKDGSTTIVMSGVSQEEYEDYKSTYDPDTVTSSATSAEGSYSIVWNEDIGTGLGTMVIDYTPAEVSSTTPSTFKTLNLATNSENIYFKMVFDSSWVYNSVIESYIEETYWAEDLELSREDAITALTQLGVTEDTCGMAVELAMKGEDMAMGIYSTSTIDMSMVITLVGNTMYTTMSMPMVDTETGVTTTMNVWYKMATEGSLEDSATDESGDSAMGVVGGMGASLDELLQTYASTGYEMIDGKVYYYEEFVIPADTEAGETEDSVVKYYFNGNDLIYAESDGARMEIVISNTIPTRLFGTECPTGYIDVSDEVA